MLTYDSEKDNEEFGMLLANNIDKGCADGGLISVKAFDQLIEDLKMWRTNKNNRGSKKVHETCS